MNQAIKAYQKMYTEVVKLGMKELDAKQEESAEYKRLQAELFGARKILEALGVDVWSVEQSVKIL